MAPEYEKAANTLKEQNSPVKLAKIDVTVESELGTRFEIQRMILVLFYFKCMPVYLSVKIYLCRHPESN